MALTVESLKGLYEKLGGTDFGDVTTIPEAIDKITEVAESGGGSITVDSELSDTSENPVQNKVITAAMIAAKPLIVHGTVDILNSTAEITDEISLGEIYDAAAAERVVAFECSLDDGNTTRLELAGYTVVNGEYTFVFSAPATQGGKPAVVSVEFENSKTGTFELAVAS